MKTNKLMTFKKYGYIYESLFSKNIVFIYGLSLTCIAVAATSVRNAIAISFATAFIMIPSVFIASFLPRDMEYEWIAVMVGFISFASIWVSFLFVNEADPSIFGTLGIYFPLLTFSTGTFMKFHQHLGSGKHSFALLDGILTSVGYFIAAFTVAAVREILASGTFMEKPLSWVTLKMPAFKMTFGGFIVIAFLAAFIKYIDRVIKIILLSLDNKSKKQ